MLSDCLVYDIGCDHALLDIYLTLYKNCRCVCYDVNKSIIDRANKNIDKYNLTGKISTNVGSGFYNMNLNSDSVVVLSGMGTSTILKILNVNRVNTIICQTNTDLFILRKTVCEYGYYISDEKLVFDNNRYYVSIKFCKGYHSYSYEEYLLGPILIRNNVKLFKEYVSCLYLKNLNAYNKSIQYEIDNDIKRQMEVIKKYRL